MPNRPHTHHARIGTEAVLQGVSHQRRRGWTAHVVCLALMVSAALTVSAAVVEGEDVRDPTDFPSVPPEQLAEVILVIKPYATLPLNLPAPTDRIVQGDVVRLEKGVLPQTIVHTRNTMGAPLQAGVSVKLYLKAFKDGHAHYIINIFPEWYGGQP